MSEDEPDIVSRLYMGPDCEPDAILMADAATEIIESRGRLMLFEERLAEALEALKPFAAASVSTVNPRYDPVFVATPFTFEDCEHARSIVEKYK